MNLADIIRDREGFFGFIKNEFGLASNGRIPFIRIDESTGSFELGREVIAAITYEEKFRKVHLTKPEYFEAFKEISDKYKEVTGIELEISKHYPVKRE